MGFEAYRIIAKFRSLEIEDMEDELKKNGAITIEKTDNSTAMEIEKPNGIIEILLRLSSHRNEVYLSIRFAKPNDIQIVDDIMILLKSIIPKYNLVLLLDAETKEKIDIDNYSSFIKMVKESQDDFKKFFPDIPYPIRCEDVFSEYRKIHSEKILKE